MCVVWRVIRSAGSDRYDQAARPICARSTRSASSIGHLRVRPPTAGHTGPMSMSPGS
jgi:hypothetical protein